MADLRYSAEIDTKAAQSSLNGLKSQIVAFSGAVAGAFAFRELSNVSSKFQDLRTTLGLLYKDVQLGSDAFDDIKKFAASSIFSVEDLTNTIIKLKAAGLEPTVSLLKMFADTSSVAADSVGALQAITDLYARTTAGGLGLEDLNRLADRGIPVFTILSERLGLSRLEIAKIGQTADGAKVILKALEDGLNDAFGGASASRANNVSQAMSNFGDAVANASDAIGRSGLNEGLSKLVRNFTQILQAATPLFEIVGTVLGGAFSFLADNIKLATAVAVAFLTTLAVGRIAAISTAVLSLVKVFNLFNIVAGKNPLVKVLSVALGLGAAIGVLSTDTNDLSSEIDKLDANGNKIANNNGFKVLKDGSLGAGTEDLKAKMATLNQELNKFRVEMDSVVASFARYNKQTVEALNLETSLLGVSRELGALRRSESDINKRLSEEIARLTEEKAKLSEEEKKQGRAGIIDSTIKKLKEQAEADKASAAAAIEANEAKMRSDNQRLFGIQTQIDLQRDLRKIQDDIAKSTMSEMARREYDILAAARERAQAEIEGEQARRGSLLTDQEKLKYYNEALKGTDKLIAAERKLYTESRTFSAGWKKAFREYTDNATNAARTAERLFQKATQGMEDLIVDFAKTGKFQWKNFVQGMVEDLLRSQIQQTFAKILGGIQGSMSGGSEGGGGILDSVFGMLGGLFGGGGDGQGKSASNPLYVSDVSGGMGTGGGITGGAGEEGGGIFSGITSMAGKVWDGIKSVGSSVLGGITSTIGGVVDTISRVGSTIGSIFSGTAGKYGTNVGSEQSRMLYEQDRGMSDGIFSTISKGIGNFFGGFFANGGMLGAGKFGIAGENGPEFIGGPASITPLGGGTNVTYNINAVDALSFKQLLAQDPGFLYGVTMQGANSIPGRR
jgi:lambda family phage tail tape measure protein